MLLPGLFRTQGADFSSIELTDVWTALHTVTGADAAGSILNYLRKTIVLWPVQSSYASSL